MLVYQRKFFKIYILISQREKLEENFAKPLSSPIIDVLKKTMSFSYYYFVYTFPSRNKSLNRDRHRILPRFLQMRNITFISFQVLSLQRNVYRANFLYVYRVFHFVAVEQ